MAGLRGDLISRGLRIFNALSVLHKGSGTTLEIEYTPAA